MSVYDTFLFTGLLSEAEGRPFLVPSEGLSPSRIGPPVFPVRLIVIGKGVCLSKCAGSGKISVIQ